jgi:hypothetical protein
VKALPERGSQPVRNINVSDVFEVLPANPERTQSAAIWPSNSQELFVVSEKNIHRSCYGQAFVLETIELGTKIKEEGAEVPGKGTRLRSTASLPYLVSNAKHSEEWGELYLLPRSWYLCTGMSRGAEYPIVC